MEYRRENEASIADRGNEDKKKTFQPRKRKSKDGREQQS